MCRLGLVLQMTLPCDMYGVVAAVACCVFRFMLGGIWAILFAVNDYDIMRSGRMFACGMWPVFDIGC